MLVLYAGTMFAGAFLLFLLEPMFTKEILPLLGGSPAVWNTALVFFQTALLGGYLYAHFAPRILGRYHLPVHLVLAAAAILTLPVVVPEGWAPTTRGSFVPWLLGASVVLVGPVFFVLSATAPLLQRWYWRAGGVGGSDPYFLYGASNVGSFLALLGYPFLIEATIGLRSQARLWSAGYAVYLVLLGTTAILAWRGAKERPEPGSATSVAESAGPAPSWTERGGWVVFALVPSSLLLGVTHHISTDLAAVPLLWVIPLALYLLTFVLTFSRNPPLRHAWMIRAYPFGIVLVVLVMMFESMGTLPAAVMGIHLGAFFLMAMVCHGELVRRRPPPEHLTEFYLWLALGGALGGAFNALVAPVLFDSVVEYPLALFLACLLVPQLRSSGQRFEWTDPVWAAGLAGAAFLVTEILLREFPETSAIVFRSSIGVAGIGLFSFRRRPVRFALGFGALLLFGSFALDRDEVVARERGFFGVKKVVLDSRGPYHVLYHGTTVHGAQDRRPGRRTEPLTYYHRESPIGRVFNALEGADVGDVGVVGLGTGSLACYAEPGQTWTFYEIDPAMERLARRSGLFSYMEECAPDARVVLGDARISLERERGERYDLLIVDAFSSDAIPVHLLTVEALRLYGERTVEDGLIVLHISNRHLNLRPIVARLTEELGWTGRVQVGPSESDPEPYRGASEWVALARTTRPLDRLDGGQWTPLSEVRSGPLWTDDFSNLLATLQWLPSRNGD